MNVPIPDDTSTKMLMVDVQKQHVKVKLRSSSEYIIDGDLYAPVKKSETIYIIDSDSQGKKQLQLSLTKKD